MFYLMLKLKIVSLLNMRNNNNSPGLSNMLQTPRVIQQGTILQYDRRRCKVELLIIIFNFLLVLLL